jgi:UDP-arabinose 4-epimerase
MRIVVTGGAGYVGSHTCKALAQAGHEPITIDNLVTGHEEAVRWGPLHVLDIRDADGMADLFQKLRPDAVIHLAALAIVSESMRDPLTYYDVNVRGTASLLRAAVAAGRSSIAFSSSCATYGVPETLPITEMTKQAPVNPYGETKLACERLLGWVQATYDLRWTALRYFNVAGADADGETGEVHENETHLIPLVLRAAAGGPPLTIYGTDYDTPDGTALRDYVHVSDIARAHVAALEYLQSGGASGGFNLGTGRPTSVREIVDAVEKVTGRSVPVRHLPKRVGDPPALWADASLATATFGWKASQSGIDEIVSTAWAWERRNARTMN